MPDGRKLSRAEVAQAMRQAGWPESLIPHYSAVAMAESGGRSGVTAYRVKKPDGTYSDEESIGIFQINMKGKLGADRRRQFGITNEDLKDPVINARVAKAIHNQQGWKAWYYTHTTGSYKKYLNGNEKSTFRGGEGAGASSGQTDIPVKSVETSAGPPIYDAEAYMGERRRGGPRDDGFIYDADAAMAPITTPTAEPLAQSTKGRRPPVKPVATPSKPVWAPKRKPIVPPPAPPPGTTGTATSTEVPTSASNVPPPSRLPSTLPVTPTGIDYSGAPSQYAPFDPNADIYRPVPEAPPQVVDEGPSEPSLTPRQLPKDFQPYNVVNLPSRTVASQVAPPKVPDGVGISGMESMARMQLEDPLTLEYLNLQMAEVSTPRIVNPARGTVNPEYQGVADRIAKFRLMYPERAARLDAQLVAAAEAEKLAGLKPFLEGEIQRLSGVLPNDPQFNSINNARSQYEAQLNDVNARLSKAIEGSAEIRTLVPEYGALSMGRESRQNITATALSEMRTRALAGFDFDVPSADLDPKRYLKLPREQQEAVFAVIANAQAGGMPWDKAKELIKYYNDYGMKQREAARNSLLGIKPERGMVGKIFDAATIASSPMGAAASAAGQYLYDKAFPKSEPSEEEIETERQRLFPLRQTEEEDIAAETAKNAPGWAKTAYYNWAGSWQRKLAGIADIPLIRSIPGMAEGIAGVRYDAAVRELQGATAYEGLGTYGKVAAAGGQLALELPIYIGLTAAAMTPVGRIPAMAALSAPARAIAVDTGILALDRMALANGQGKSLSDIIAAGKRGAAEGALYGIGGNIMVGVAGRIIEPALRRTFGGAVAPSGIKGRAAELLGRTKPSDTIEAATTRGMVTAEAERLTAKKAAGQELTQNETKFLGAYEAVRKQLAREGVGPTATSGPSKKPPKESIEALVVQEFEATPEFAAGVAASGLPNRAPTKSVADIAAKFNISEDYVRSILQQYSTAYDKRRAFLPIFQPAALKQADAKLATLRAQLEKPEMIALLKSRPGLYRTYLTAQILGFGVRTGTIFGGTVALEVADGQKTKDALYNAAQMSFMDMIMHGITGRGGLSARLRRDRMEQLAGKPVSIVNTTTGERGVFSMDPDGTIRHYDNGVEQGLLEAEIYTTTPTPERIDAARARLLESVGDNSGDIKVVPIAVGDAEAGTQRQSPIVDVDGTQVVVMDVGGKNIPFYLKEFQTAEGTQSKWVPFMGIDPETGALQTDAAREGAYFDSPVLRNIGEGLDRQLGPMKRGTTEGLETTVADLQAKMQEAKEILRMMEEGEIPYETTRLSRRKKEVKVVEYRQGTPEEIAKVRARIAELEPQLKKAEDALAREGRVQEGLAAPKLAKDSPFIAILNKDVVDMDGAVAHAELIGSRRRTPITVPKTKDTRWGTQESPRIPPSDKFDDMPDGTRVYNPEFGTYGTIKTMKPTKGAKGEGAYGPDDRIVGMRYIEYENRGVKERVYDEQGGFDKWEYRAPEESKVKFMERFDDVEAPPDRWTLPKGVKREDLDDFSAEKQVYERVNEIRSKTDDTNKLISGYNDLVDDINKRREAKKTVDAKLQSFNALKKQVEATVNKAKAEIARRQKTFQAEYDKRRRTNAKSAASFKAATTRRINTLNATIADSEGKLTAAAKRNQQLLGQASELDAQIRAGMQQAKEDYAAITRNLRSLKGLKEQLPEDYKQAAAERRNPPSPEELAERRLKVSTRKGATFRELVEPEIRDTPTATLQRNREAAAQVDAEIKAKEKELADLEAKSKNTDLDAKERKQAAAEAKQVNKELKDLRKQRKDLDAIHDRLKKHRDQREKGQGDNLRRPKVGEKVINPFTGRVGVVKAREGGATAEQVKEQFTTDKAKEIARGKVVVSPKTKATPAQRLYVEQKIADGSVVRKPLDGDWELDLSANPKNPFEAKQAPQRGAKQQSAEQQKAFEQAQRRADNVATPKQQAKLDAIAATEQKRKAAQNDPKTTRKTVRDMAKKALKAGIISQEGFDSIDKALRTRTDVGAVLRAVAEKVGISKAAIDTITARVGKPRNMLSVFQQAYEDKLINKKALTVLQNALARHNKQIDADIDFARQRGSDGRRLLADMADQARLSKSVVAELDKALLTARDPMTVLNDAYRRQIISADALKIFEAEFTKRQNAVAGDIASIRGRVFDATDLIQQLAKKGGMKPAAATELIKRYKGGADGQRATGGPKVDPLQAFRDARKEGLISQKALTALEQEFATSNAGLDAGLMAFKQALWQKGSEITKAVERRVNLTPAQREGMRAAKAKAVNVVESMGRIKAAAETPNGFRTVVAEVKALKAQGLIPNAPDKPAKGVPAALTEAIKTFTNARQKERASAGTRIQGKPKSQYYGDLLKQMNADGVIDGATYARLAKPLAKLAELEGQFTGKRAYDSKASTKLRTAYETQLQGFKDDVASTLQANKKKAPINEWVKTIQDYVQDEVERQDARFRVAREGKAPEAKELSAAKALNEIDTAINSAGQINAIEAANPTQMVGGKNRTQLYQDLINTMDQRGVLDSGARKTLQAALKEVADIEKQISDTRLEGRSTTQLERGWRQRVNDLQTTMDAELQLMRAKIESGDFKVVPKAPKPTPAKPTAAAKVTETPAVAKATAKDVDAAIKAVSDLDKKRKAKKADSNSVTALIQDLSNKEVLTTKQANDLMALKSDAQKVKGMRTILREQQKAAKAAEKVEAAAPAKTTEPAKAAEAPKVEEAAPSKPATKKDVQGGIKDFQGKRNALKAGADELYLDASWEDLRAKGVLTDAEVATLRGLDSQEAVTKTLEVLQRKLKDVDKQPTAKVAEAAPVVAKAAEPAPVETAPAVREQSAAAAKAEKAIAQTDADLARNKAARTDLGKQIAAKEATLGELKKRLEGKMTPSQRQKVKDRIKAQEKELGQLRRNEKGMDALITSLENKRIKQQLVGEQVGKEEFTIRVARLKAAGMTNAELSRQTGLPVSRFQKVEPRGEKGAFGQASWKLKGEMGDTATFTSLRDTFTDTAVSMSDENIQLVTDAMARKVGKTRSSELNKSDYEKLLKEYGDKMTEPGRAALRAAIEHQAQVFNPGANKFIASPMGKKILALAQKQGVKTWDEIKMPAGLTKKQVMEAAAEFGIKGKSAKSIVNAVLSGKKRPRFDKTSDKAKFFGSQMTDDGVNVKMQAMDDVDKILQDIENDPFNPDADFEFDRAIQFMQEQGIVTRKEVDAIFKRNLANPENSVGDFRALLDVARKEYSAEPIVRERNEFHRRLRNVLDNAKNTFSGKRTWFGGFLERNGMSVERDGSSISTNINGIAVLNMALRKMGGRKNVTVEGAYIPKENVAELVDLLDTMSKNMIAKNERVAAAHVSTMRDEIIAASRTPYGDVAIMPKEVEFQNIARAVREEELAHMADMRVLNKADVKPYKDVDAYNQAVAHIRYRYPGAKAADIHREVIAKAFLTNAEVELNLTPQQVDDILDVYMTQLQKKGITAETVEEQFGRINEKAKQFANKYGIERLRNVEEARPSRQRKTDVDVEGARAARQAGMAEYAGNALKGTEPDIQRKPSYADVELSAQEEAGLNTIPAEMRDAVREEIKLIKWEMEQERLAKLKAAKDKKKGTTTEEEFKWTTGSVISEIFSASKSLKSSFDLSAIGRQGWILLSGQGPLQLTKKIWMGARSYFGDYGIDVQKKLMQHPLYEMAREAGLKMATGGGERAEIYQSRLFGEERLFKGDTAEKIRRGMSWHVRKSEVSFNAVIDSIRLETFIKGVEQAKAKAAKQGKQFTDTDAQQIAHFINFATGHGNLPKNFLGMGINTDRAVPFLNLPFYSARLAASRFQVMNPFTYAYMYKASPLATQFAAKQLGKFLAVNVGLLVAAGALGAKVELDDPTDPGAFRLTVPYGKGTMSVDVMAGLPQALTLASRMMAYPFRESEYYPFRQAKMLGSGQKDRDLVDTYSGLIGRYLRKKLSPLAASGINALSGENVMGEPTSLTGEMKNMPFPIAFGQFADNLRDSGVDAAVVLGGMELLGFTSTMLPTVEAYNARIEGIRKDPDIDLKEKKRQIKSLTDMRNYAVRENKIRARLEKEGSGWKRLLKAFEYTQPIDEGKQLERKPETEESPL